MSSSDPALLNYMFRAEQSTVHDAQRAASLSNVGSGRLTRTGGPHARSMYEQVAKSIQPSQVLDWLPAYGRRFT